MKRETFEIKANGVVFDTRSKWNSSIRSIEGKVNEIAKVESTVYELVDSHSEKEGFYNVRGFRVWKGRNGNVIKFEVEKKL